MFFVYWFLSKELRSSMKIPSINFLIDLSIQKYVVIFMRISMDINHAKKRNQYPLKQYQIIITIPIMAYQVLQNKLLFQLQLEIMKCCWQPQWLPILATDDQLLKKQYTKMTKYQAWNDINVTFLILGTPSIPTLSRLSSNGRLWVGGSNPWTISVAKWVQ